MRLHFPHNEHLYIILCVDKCDCRECWNIDEWPCNHFVWLYWASSDHTQLGSCDKISWRCCKTTRIWKVHSKWQCKKACKLYCNTMQSNSILATCTLTCIGCTNVMKWTLSMSVCKRYCYTLGWHQWLASWHSRRALCRVSYKKLFLNSSTYPYMYQHSNGYH